MFSLSVHQVIERMMQGKPITENKDGYKKIILPPNDLVYVPTPEEIISRKIDWTNRNKIFKRIYKMISSTDSYCYFLPHFISNILFKYDSKLKKGEFESQNKSEKTMDNKQIIKEFIDNI